MKLKNIAAFLAALVFATSPAGAQTISIPIPIPSLPLPLPFFRSTSSQRQVDPMERRFTQYWNEGVAASRAKDYRTAVTKYRMALAIHPDNHELRLYYGQAQRQAGMTAAALATGKRLMAVNPREEAVWRLVMNCYIDSNQLENAAAMGEEILQRFPGSKYRKTIELDVKNVRRELEKRSKAPTLLSSGGEDYLAFACQQGLFRWPLEKMPLKVYLASGKGVRKWRDELLPPVRQAFDQWTIASAGIVRFVEVDDEASADIVLKWDDGSKDLGHAGHARPEDYENGWLKRASITLHTAVPHMKSEVTPRTVYETAQHEIGHALGLMGHSDNPSDIMYWSATPVSRRISARDVRTLMRLYAVDHAQVEAAAAATANATGGAGEGVVAAGGTADGGGGAIDGNSYGSQQQPQQMMANNGYNYGYGGMAGVVGNSGYPGMTQETMPAAAGFSYAPNMVQQAGGTNYAYAPQQYAMNGAQTQTTDATQQYAMNGAQMQMATPTQQYVMNSGQVQMAMPMQQYAMNMQMQPGYQYAQYQQQQQQPQQMQMQPATGYHYAQYQAMPMQQPSQSTYGYAPQQLPMNMGQANGGYPQQPASYTYRTGN